MPLLSPTNLTFDLYRGYTAANPYNPPNRPAASAGIQGILKHHVRCGRFGYRIPGQNNAPIYWTTVLLIPIGQQIRDGYNSELNTFTVSNGNTVMAYDYPNPGDCCAFNVVMVQRKARHNRRPFPLLSRSRPAIVGFNLPGSESGRWACYQSLLSRRNAGDPLCVGQRSDE